MLMQELYPMPKPYKPKEWTDIKSVYFSQGEAAEGLVLANKRVSAWYRDSLQIIKIIYDHAFDFLCEVLDEPDGEIHLPVDIQKVAQNCNFTISFEALPSFGESNRISSVAQLQMRRKLSGSGEITGTIRLADYLSETSARFSIAHELGHYVLREHSPIGLNYMLSACPGLYPLADTDELLADLFAYGLLLPYPSFMKLKAEYEKDDSRWPVDFSDWISFLQEQTQMPEYHVVLAYQGLKQYSLAEKLEYAQEKTPPDLERLIESLLKQKLTKDQIIEVLKFEYSEAKKNLQGTAEDLTPENRKLQESTQEIVELVQDRLSIEQLPPKRIVDDNAETPYFSFSLDWVKSIIQNLYQQGISSKIIADATDVELDLVNQYIQEYVSTESKSSQ